jgi:hypothetical protein
MKKILSISLLLASMAIVGTGCLKDKGFDNYEYGINSPETGAKGVGLPLAIAPQVIGIELKGTTQTISNILVANFLSGSPVPNDTKVNLVLNPTLVGDYNTANSASLVVLPPAVYSLPTTTITIKAGQNLGKLDILLPNTLSLDATKTYALGFSISSVDGGYTIASNLKNLLVIFNVKNKYDGLYQLRGYHNRPSPDYTLPYNVKVELRTSGPSSVVMWYPTPGPNDYAHPINGSTGSYYGSLSPDFNFDPVTNLASTIQNYVPYGPTTPPLSYVTGPGIVNRANFDPVTNKPTTITLLWRYNANDLRRFYDTLTYIGPR